MIVAIDGPAGAGKSTVARSLAGRLGFRYLDTGAMYRALTWLALEEGVDLEDGPALGSLAGAAPISFDGERVFIREHDVTEEIRQAEIDRVVSTVARHPQVREVMRDRQRELAEQGDAVIEGRDIGTVVCPDADVKVYLVADSAERTRDRRGSARDGLATARSARRGPDAARPGCGEDRHDRARGGGSGRQDRALGRGTREGPDVSATQT
jgi:cytidylate kinase